MKAVDARRAIGESLESVPVIDPHCHLDPLQVGARNLTDVVLYHHVWIELVSAGMGLREVTEAGLPHEIADPGMEPFERLRRAVPYLPRIRNTTLGLLLRWLLQDLFGVREELTERNLEQVYRSVDQACGAAGWSRQVLAGVCGIERSLTVEGLEMPSPPALLKGNEALTCVNIADGKSTPREKLLQMVASFGRDIESAAGFRDFVCARIRSLPLGDLRFLGAWLLPHLTDELADESGVTRILRKARSGEPLHPSELGSVSFFGLTAALEELSRGSLRTIQVLVGAEVLRPHRSLTHWDGSFVGALGRLAGRFEEFRFNCSSAADAHSQDLCVLAKHVPNISVAGYWWHTLYPFYIRKSLEIRLDMVPASKIVAYFSDAYHCEWCAPKLKLVKQILGDILEERVDRGWYDVDTAIGIVRDVFYEAPRSIYGL